jgi:hypothetical protein
LTDLEVGSVGRNPLLAARLKPGLAPDAIQRALRRGRVAGPIGPIIELYSWKNGTVLDPQLARSKSGFFPGHPFYLLDLEMALGHFDHARAAARSNPRLLGGASYFPVFWDGSTNWLALDLADQRHSRVILVRHAEESPYREVYRSFDEFLSAAIRSIALNEDLPLAGLP